MSGSYDLQSKQELEEYALNKGEHGPGAIAESKSVPDKVGTGAHRPPLPRYIMFAIACGNFGVSVQANMLVNLIVRFYNLVYFYLPPDSAELPSLVTEKTFLGIINAIAVILAFGRLTDSITDVLVANWSDRTHSKWGRRIPFMAVGMIPGAAATILMFVPPVTSISRWNIVYLVCMQIVLFTFLTMYFTPLLTLIPDLGATPDERLNLTVWTSVFWAIGMVVAAMTFFVAPLLYPMLPDTEIGHMRAWQIAIAGICIIGFIAMLVPVLVVNEPKWSRNEPTSVPFFKSMKTCLGNQYYRKVIASDFFTFCATNLLQTGILYYVTVLLELKEYISTVLILVLVVISIFLYPVVALFAKKLNGGKGLLMVAFVLEAVVFLFVSVMGLSKTAAFAQVIIPIAVFTIPYSILTTMFAWATADIAEHHYLSTGEAVAGMFYATRTFFQKLASTVAVIVFALLLQLGKDVGDDLGIRLSGVVGAALALCAAVMMWFYNEKKMQKELKEMLQAKQKATELATFSSRPYESRV